MTNHTKPNALALTPALDALLSKSWLKSYPMWLLDKHSTITEDGTWAYLDREENEYPIIMADFDDVIISPELDVMCSFRVFKTGIRQCVITPKR